MLDSLSKTSDLIEGERLQERTDGLQFDILKDDSPTGIRFRGVPGGHEFSSLVLAILNASGKGKLPDQMVQSRIAALRGL